MADNKWRNNGSIFYRSFLLGVIRSLKLKLIERLNNLEQNQVAEAVLKKLFSNYPEGLVDFIHTCRVIKTGIWTLSPMALVETISLNGMEILHFQISTLSPSIPTSKSSLPPNVWMVSTLSIVTTSLNPNLLLDPQNWYQWGIRHSQIVSNLLILGRQ